MAPNNAGRLSSMVRRSLLIGAGLVMVAVIIGGFLAGRGERSSEAANNAPVNAPSRMRAAHGPLGDEAAVVLDSAALARADIATRVLHPAVNGGTLRLFGELRADPTGITTLRAPVAGRLLAQHGHWPALGENVAAGATVAQVSDALPVGLQLGGTVTRVSAQPGELVQAGQELLQLTDFSVLLARIAWPPEAPRAPPRRITLTPLGGSDASAPPRASATADLVGPAADVDSVTRFPVYLYRTTGTWAGARPGAPVEAMLVKPGGPATGAVVPATAVVQWSGLAWAYVQQRGWRDSTRFVRRRVDTSRPVPGGWLVTSADALGVRAGDRVVVRGAEALLSEEFRSRVSIGG